MQRTIIGMICLLEVLTLHSQTVISRLTEAVRKFEGDPQMKHAILSLCVVDSRNGKKIFAKNSQVGLAPASCQKVFTSAAGFELLGKDYRYKTELGYDGRIENGVLKGNLFFLGSGDPTLGSWRWKSTTDSVLLKKWLTDVRNAGIRTIERIISYDMCRFSLQTIPDGWIWQDVGNYYGAGADVLNWHENQYDLIMKPGKQPGDSVTLVNERKFYSMGPYYNELSTAAKGTGDNAYIYLPVGTSTALVKGTIPAGEKKFSISGALPHPADEMIGELELTLMLNGIVAHGETGIRGDIITDKKFCFQPVKIISTYFSPPLDSINYWFLQKSINLYGEALIKLIAFEKEKFGSTEKGVDIVRSFWSRHGIDKSAINILDGSGLSPQNRVTTDALVKVMQFARTKPWFNSFYNALPEINGTKMKSGYIGGTKSYTGYIRNKLGIEYTFAIIVNNYDGSPPDITRKMWAILDILK